MSRPAAPQKIVVDRDDLVAAVAHQLDRGLRLALVAAHEEVSSFRIVHVFLGDAGERVEVVVAVPRDDAWLPTLARISYQAGRFEREMHDLYGIVSRDHPQPFRLVRHGHWPAGYYPMRSDAITPTSSETLAP